MSAQASNRKAAQGPRWAGRGPVSLVFGHKNEEGQRPCHRRWMDHTYTLETPEGTVYAAEPYELDEDAFADFVVLGKAGWDVYVTATEAQHYPGHSIAVHIRRRP